MPVYRHEVLGLIGPNGSGKSTFINAITGVVPAKGSLRFDGHDVPLEDAAAVRGCGVLRTYQTPQTFLDLTCIENVLLSTTDRRYTGIVSPRVLRPLMLARERKRWHHAAVALDRVGLLHRGRGRGLDPLLWPATAARAGPNHRRRSSDGAPRRAVGRPQRQ